MCPVVENGKVRLGGMRIDQIELGKTVSRKLVYRLPPKKVSEVDAPVLRGGK